MDTLKNFWLRGGILLLSITCGFSQVKLSGRVALGGRVTVGPQVRGIVFSDWHYSSNFDSNNTTRVIAGAPTITVGWTNMDGSIEAAGTTATYDVFFKIDGGSLLATNWSGNVTSEGDFGVTYVFGVTVTAHSSGYDSGPQYINFTYSAPFAYDPCDPGPFISYDLVNALGANPTISPAQNILFVHLRYTLTAPMGASFHLKDFNFILNQ